MAGILVVSLIGKIDIFKTTIIVASGFFLIVLPPLIDRFVSLRVVPYEYIWPKEFIKNMSTFFLFTPKVGLGIRLEIAAILVLASFYVIVKSRSLIRGFLTGILLYLLVGLSVTPRLYLPVPEMTDLVVRQYKHIVYTSFYLVLCAIVSIFFLYRINRAFPKALFNELASFRTIHFVLMVIVGIHLNQTLNFFDFPDYLFILISIVVIVVLWLSTLLTNSVYDLAIDKISNPKRPLVKGVVNPSDYLNLSFVIAVIAIFLSSVLGIVPFIVTFIIIASSIAYSMPPLRLRKRLFGTLFIGWGSSLAFFIGFFCGNKIRDLSITSEAILLAILIFIALSFGSLTKDLKDFQGDVQSGVRTFFTIFGIKKGKLIVSIFLCLSLLIPILLFHKMSDLFFFVIASILTSVLFFVREEVVISYIGYGMVFTYCALRFLGAI
jgi:4-hydroxybenzoate polyprenyltransferase